MQSSIKPQKFDKKPEGRISDEKRERNSKLNKIQRGKVRNFEM